MEKTRRQLRVFAGLLAAASAALACFLALAVRVLDRRGDEFSDFFKGFHVGMLGTLIVVFLVMTVRLLRTAKNDERLAAYRIRANDERTLRISEKSGGIVLYGCSLGLLTAAVVGGYFNATVFFTLLIAAVVQISALIALRTYYEKTM
ncbi:MAG: hypothetical protein QM689_07675 [Oscillospiraceae bacterium]